MAKQPRLTQCEMILAFMRAGEKITAISALTDFGCFRLASRICDLRKDGHSIKDKTIYVHNRFGDKIHVSQYWMEKN